MKEKRTGLVCTVEAVPEGHQVGIVWTSNREGRQIGFVYDEDATARDEIAGKVEGYCKANGFSVGDSLEEAFWIERARIEEVSQGLFVDWFGGKPYAEGLFFDGWGKVDDYKEAFGVPEGFASSAMTESRARSRKAGLKAGMATAGVMAAGLVVFSIVSYATAGDAPVQLSAYTLLGTVLTVCGGVFLIAAAQDIARFFYRKFL